MTLITRSADHYYTYEGQTYPGVTGLLKVIDKSDALMAWAARNTAEAAIVMASGYKACPNHDPNGGPGSDQCMTCGVYAKYPDWHGRSQSALDIIVDTVGKDGTIKALTSRSSWKRDEAAALGTEVHNLADLVVRGQPTPPMGETTRHRVLKYAEWWKASGWTLRTSEAEVVNPVEGYGGTIDLLARDRDGATVLADIKTGKAVYWEAVLQLCAYGNATFIQHGAQVFPMPTPDRYVILHVTADAVREIEVNIGGQEWQAFQACIDLTRWRETLKGRSM